MKFYFFCKRCGESQSFDSRKERDLFKEEHRPRHPMIKRLRMYACKMIPIRHKQGFILRRNTI